MGIFDKVKACWARLGGKAAAVAEEVALERASRVEEDSALAVAIQELPEMELPPGAREAVSWVKLCDDGDVLCNGKVYDAEGRARTVVVEPIAPRRTTTASRRQQAAKRDRRNTTAVPTAYGLNRAQRRALASIQRRK